VKFACSVTKRSVQLFTSTLSSWISSADSLAMSSLLSCCFPSREQELDLERQPLLHDEQTGPASNDATHRQEALHHKFRVYQMFMALSHGNLPSTEQLIANLRALLATDALQAELGHHKGANLSPAGRKLVLEARELIKDSITLLQHKNGKDEVQDLVWHLTKARVSVDVKDVGRKMGKAKEKADVVAGKSMKSPHCSVFDI
jgi:hypothetical protein